MTVAEFSTNGAKILLSFDAATDRAGSGGEDFYCDALIEFPAASAAICAWTADDAAWHGEWLSSSCGPVAHGKRGTPSSDAIEARRDKKSAGLMDMHPEDPKYAGK